jgi:HPt (histidine-containing phosphotransfer) domain-containing protein
MSFDKLQQIDGLDTAQGLVNCMDDESLYCSIVGMYVDQLKQNIPTLTSQFESQDWVEYGRTCHSIKGASASVGAVKIQEKSASLEQAGKNEQINVISAEHEKFIALLNEAVEQMSV